MSYFFDKFLGTGRVGDTGGGGGGTPSGGSGAYPVTNMVLVDPDLTAVAGQVYNDFATADTYVATQTPSATNTWVIQFSSGVFADNLTIRPFVKIMGVGPSTILEGTIASTVTFGDVAGVSFSGIENATVDNMTGTAASIHTFVNVTFTGGTATAGIIFSAYNCVVRNAVDFTSAGGQIGFINCVNYAGTYTSNSSFTSCNVTNALGDALTFNGGVFNSSYLGGTPTINDGNFSFFKSFISSAVTLPTIATGTWNFNDTTSNNELSITHSTPINTLQGCTNLVFIDSSQTVTTNALRTPQTKFYEVQVQPADLAVANTTATITLKDIIPARARVLNVSCYPTQQFTSSGAISALTVDLGITGSTTEFLTGFNMWTAPSDSNFKDVAYNSMLNVSTNEDFIATFTATGDDLDTLDAGNLVVTISYIEQY